MEVLINSFSKLLKLFLPVLAQCSLIQAKCHVCHLPHDNVHSTHNFTHVCTHTHEYTDTHKNTHTHECTYKHVQKQTLKNLPLTLSVPTPWLLCVACGEDDGSHHHQYFQNLQIEY